MKVRFSFLSLRNVKRNLYLFSCSFTFLIEFTFSSLPETFVCPNLFLAKRSGLVRFFAIMFNNTNDFVLLVGTTLSYRISDFGLLCEFIYGYLVVGMTPMVLPKLTNTQSIKGM